ncbi:unnamed protein product [Gordionus sp. m RMFG-2023]
MDQEMKDLKIPSNRVEDIQSNNGVSGEAKFIQDNKTNNMNTPYLSSASSTTSPQLNPLSLSTEYLIKTPNKSKLKHRFKSLAPVSLQSKFADSDAEEDTIYKKRLNNSSVNAKRKSLLSRIFQPTLSPDDKLESGSKENGKLPTASKTYNTFVLNDHNMLNHQEIRENDLLDNDSPHAIADPVLRQRTKRRVTIPAHFDHSSFMNSDTAAFSRKRDRFLSRPSIFTTQMRYFHYVCSGLYELLILDFSLFILIGKKG